MINTVMKKAVVVIMSLCFTTLVYSGVNTGSKLGVLTKETSISALDSLYGKIARDLDRTPDELGLHAIDIAEGKCNASITCSDGTTVSCSVSAPLAICGTGPDGGGCFKAVVYGNGHIEVVDGTILSCD
jgi:hypothetical protein